VKCAKYNNKYQSITADISIIIMWQNRIVTIHQQCKAKPVEMPLDKGEAYGESSKQVAALLKKL
jgi:hypothetical protein